MLVEKRKKWYAEHPKTHTLAVGDRVAVFCDANGGGIGIVKEISGDEMYYTMFSPNVIYRKKIKDVALERAELAMGDEWTRLHAQARAGRRPMPFVTILVVLAYKLGYRARRKGVQR